MANQRELVFEILKYIKAGQAIAAYYLDISFSVFKDRLYENKETRFFPNDEESGLNNLCKSIVRKTTYNTSRNTCSA